MPSTSPTWRRVFDRVERGVGVPLERLVRSERFFDAVSLTTRARSDVNRRLERLSRRTLHALNLPTATDVKLMRDQVARIDRRAVAVQKRLEETVLGEPELEEEALRDAATRTP